jgi:hypothetical protein
VGSTFEPMNLDRVLAALAAIDQLCFPIVRSERVQL